jgi:hypothetical protein
MSTLIVGDVHACADELAELVQQHAPDRLILVGDVFNKGPKPDETWAVIAEHQAESVMGNHDLHVIAAAARGERLAPSAAVQWLKGLPITIGGETPRPWIVVHGGLDPEAGVAGTTRAQAVRMRRWPDEQSEFWWRQWAGPPLVVYGHDAVRGLQDHRPHTLGLDTGCVYGGRLTGYLLEADQVVSVAARGVYRVVG